jgi:tRNA 2-thiouridine synthesizing protein E
MASIIALSRAGERGTPDVDEEGFLLDPEKWSKEVAQRLAAEEVAGDLTEDHWKVIDFLRAYYDDCKSVPPVAMLRKRTGVNLQTIYRLFPSGLTKGACRLAGIPRATILPGFLYP